MKARDIQTRDDQVPPIGIVGSPSAPLRKEHDRGFVAFGQFEYSVDLAVVVVALRARQDGRVDDENRAARILGTEEFRVDRAKTGDDRVGRGLALELIQGTHLAHRGNREASVLDEAVGIAEVVEILACCALAPSASAINCIGPAFIEKKRVSSQ